MNHDEYMKKMYREFCLANGIKEGRKVEYNSDFRRFLISKDESSVVYAKFFEYAMENNLDFSDYVVEIGKGLFDTSVRKLTTDELNAIVVSPYASSLGADKTVKSFNGDLLLHPDYGTMIAYQGGDLTYPNCNMHINQEVGSLLLPVNRENIDKYLSLLDSRSNLFIGTHGNITDKNIKDILEDLRCLHDILSREYVKDVEFYSETYDDYYVAALGLTDGRTKKCGIGGR